MRSIFPGKRNPKRLAAALLSAAMAVGGVAWATHVGQAGGLPDDPLQLQVLAGAGRQDKALARLESLAGDGAPVAQRVLGEVLLSRGEQATAAAGWLRRAAEGGDTAAAFVLGKLYLNGAPGVARDAPQGAAWLGVAARAGHTGAAYHLGIAYRNGYGVDASDVEAARWLAASAERGVPAALFMLANAYREGAGVPRNEGEAMRLYAEAAELEHPEAIQTLAMAYRNGELGLAPDEAEARHYVMETAHALKHPALKP